MLFASNCNTDGWLASYGRPSKEGALGLTTLRVIYKAYSGFCTQALRWASVKSVSKKWIAVPFSTLLIVDANSGSKVNFLVSKKNYEWLQKYCTMAIDTYAKANYEEGYNFNLDWYEC